MPNQPLPPKIRTPGVIACELGVPLHRVQYVLSTRPHITPIATAGRIRLFDRDSVELVRIELAKIDDGSGSAVNS